LAQNILNEVKKKHVDGAELVFDYTNNPSIISVLKPLIGKNGVMKMSNYTIEALEAEDHVLISAFDEKIDAIEQDIVRKLFSLAGQVQSDRIVISDDEKKKLDTALDSLEWETYRPLKHLTSAYADATVFCSPAVSPLPTPSANPTPNHGTSACPTARRSWPRNAPGSRATRSAGKSC
jgi:hypothetical protein